MTCTFDDFEREEAMNNLGDAVYDCNMDLDELLEYVYCVRYGQRVRIQNPTYVLYIS